MNDLLTNITDELGESICSQFSFHERKGKLYLQSPFYHDDGDGLRIIVKKAEGGDYIVTDEGHTLMRLSYNLTMKQVNSGQRKDMIDMLLGHYEIENHLGEYRIKTSVNKLVDALFRMIHFCIRIEDIELLSQQYSPNTFVKDFKREAEIRFKKSAIIDWHDEEHDDRGDYNVDIMLENSGRNFGIFPMHTSHQIMNNTITIHRLRQWGNAIKFLGVIQDRQEVSDSSIHKFEDASERIYYLNGNDKETVFDNIQTLLTA